MNRTLTTRLLRAGMTIMHDGEQREVMGFGMAKAKVIMGELELDALYRFHCLGAEARAQALRLTSNRERFILREYVSQQVYAECVTLDDVGEAIEKRKADQSDRVVRLRELASGHLREGEHRGGWVDHAARVRMEERRVNRCYVAGCNAAIPAEWNRCAAHGGREG